MRYPDFVEERKAHGALCHICPFKGQRRAGHDGPATAEHIYILDTPTRGDSENLLGKTRYGRVLNDKTGYFVKKNYLAPLGLVDLVPNPDPKKSQFPWIGQLKVHIMAVTMCHPPDIKKLDSAIVKKAVKCCANSARWFLNERLAANPNIMLNPAGAIVLSLVRNEPMPIEPYRGRYMVKSPEPFPYEDENAIATVVLRGVKPKEEWWPTFEIWLKSFIKLWKVTSRSIVASQTRDALALYLGENPWLPGWTKLWKKQKAAMVKASKKEKSNE
jgi:hypothetical protein